MSEITNGAKSVVKSKLSWLGVLLFIVAVVDLVGSSTLIPKVVIDWILLVGAVATVALRVFFTDQPVKLK